MIRIIVSFWKNDVLAKYIDGTVEIWRSNQTYKMISSKNFFYAWFRENELDIHMRCSYKHNLRREITTICFLFFSFFFPFVKLILHLPSLQPNLYHWYRLRTRCTRMIHLFLELYHVRLGFCAYLQKRKKYIFMS